MQTSILLVGQGIAGTFLSWNLQQAGIDHIVIDEARPNTASRIAAGIINPVTGRRIVKTWLIDAIMPFAWEAYQQLGQQLQVNAIEEKSIVDFFPTPQMKIAFEKRFEEDQEYLSLPQQPDDWQPWLQYDFGYGAIQPAYLVNLQAILPAYRDHLQKRNQLLEEKFEYEALEFSNDSIRYKDITASRIIFCEGIVGEQNPWFRLLPFALNKGEAVWVEIDELPRTHIFKKGFNLVPWKDNIWWLGSTYLWEFPDDRPTPGFRQFADTWLKQTLKVPFRIVDHQAGIRPATLERRPFVGFHPQYPALGIFNGMGTKGCSLSPYFAQQLVEEISGRGMVLPEAGVQRFKRVLMMNS